MTVPTRLLIVSRVTLCIVPRTCCRDASQLIRKAIISLSLYTPSAIDPSRSLKSLSFYSAPLAVALYLLTVFPHGSPLPILTGCQQSRRSAMLSAFGIVRSRGGTDRKDDNKYMTRWHQARKKRTAREREIKKETSARKKKEEKEKEKRHIG